MAGRADPDDDGADNMGGVDGSITPDDIRVLAAATAELGDVPPELAAPLLARSGAIADQVEARLALVESSSPRLLAVRRLKGSALACLDAGLSRAEARARLGDLAHGCGLDDVSRAFLDRAADEALGPVGGGA